jgi:hypothetical protein
LVPFQWEYLPGKASEISRLLSVKSRLFNLLWLVVCSTACLESHSGSSSLEHRGRCVSPRQLSRQELFISSMKTEYQCTDRDLLYLSGLYCPTDSVQHQPTCKAGMPFLWARNLPELNCKALEQRQTSAFISIRNRALSLSTDSALIQRR